MEGIMKKKLLMGVAALALACSSVQAGFFKIEGEEDITRVVFQVNSFLNTNESYLNEADKENLLSAQNRPIFEKIVSKSTSPLIKEMIENEETFWANLVQCYKFIKSKKDPIQEQVGEALYNNTLKGLLLIGNVFKSMHTTN